VIVGEQAVLYQTAPFPHELMRLVEALEYKAGWRFVLADIDRGQGSEGLTLVITITCPDSYHPEQTKSVVHYMPVPPAAFDERSWRRWLFDQISDVETHERCEFFQIDGVRPYAPSHAPGNSPYLVREVGTVEDVRTSFRGDLNPAAG
jgi:hypothetical protein